MKTGFYPKLALDGIRKNKRLVVPYILTCIGMVMMYYIILFLHYTPTLEYLRGAATIQAMLGFGGWIIAIFAGIFLFYTNSFLIRRRKKEFGLYNVLGMGKRNIGRILFWETLFIALLALTVGLISGIVLSEIAELGMIKIMHGEVDYTLSISTEALRMTVSVFGVIFVLLFLHGLRQVRMSSVVTLLRSENVGEKPPKGNWFWGILGLLLLGVAYWLAVTIRDPITALATFFGAVVLVILGTYLVMIAGSVLLCRILQKKKNYYYKANHFVSISSMAYRMKRNGAGLASICILATMVLVMISSTTSLYFGSEDSLHNRYPREIDTDFRLTDMQDLSDANIAALQEEILAVAGRYGVTPENAYAYRNIYVSGLLKDGVVETDVTKVNGVDTITNIWQFYFIPLADYNAVMGTDETLEKGEALVYLFRGEYKEDTISFNRGNTFHIRKQVKHFVADGDATMAIVPSMILVVPDLAESVRGLDAMADYNGNRMITLRWLFNFDTGLDVEKQIALYHSLLDRLRDLDIKEQYGFYAYNCNSREYNRSDFYGLFGGFFYLGIMLSTVFIFAAVLIIYYKQISEGYEDQARFAIMQKVGMTGREIRRSINSQLLTVFFLPLLFATVHLVFAFPMIRKLLLLFNLNNVLLFALTTGISVLVFALFYTLVYRITSNAYYKIVSGAKTVK